MRIMEKLKSHLKKFLRTEKNKKVEMGNISWKDSDVIQYSMTFELKYRIFLLKVKYNTVVEKKLILPIQTVEYSVPQEYTISPDIYQH
jgi:hypothetical protein